MLQEKFTTEFKPALTVLKMQPKTEYRVMFLSNRSVVYYTHFIGRQYLCPGENCAACDTFGKREVMMTLVSESGKMYLLELSRSCAEYIERSGVIDGGLEKIGGACFTMSRADAYSTIKAKFVVKKDLAFDHEEKLIPAICRLFNIPDQIAEMSDDRRKAAMIECSRQKIETAMNIQNPNDTLPF